MSFVNYFTTKSSLCIGAIDVCGSLSTRARRSDRRPARRRLDRGASTRSPDVDAFGTVSFRSLGSNRPDEREAASCRARGWTRRIDREIFSENEGEHLVLHELSSDVPSEGRRIALAPVLVHDVEVERVADDDDVLHRADRVGVVAASADHPSEPAID